MGDLLKRQAIVLLLIVSISMPWALLQSAAWAGMLVRYTGQAGLARGIAMTFDGKHPCRLCHLVKEGRAGEQQNTPRVTSERFEWELALAPVPAALIHPSKPAPAAVPEPAPEGFLPDPPTPPPRSC